MCIKVETYMVYYCGLTRDSAHIGVFCSCMRVKKKRENISKGSELPTDMKSGRLNANQYYTRQDETMERGTGTQRMTREK